MTQFIGVEDMRRLVRSTGTKAFLTQLAGYIRSDFSRWSEFEKSSRVASHSRDGVIELMPTSDGQLYTFKYVNGHPSNPRTGKLTVTAFGVLADVATGYPLLISEMTLLTALRTAATSAFAASVLARPESRVMALIGAGAQSEFQALAFQALLGIEEIRVYDPDPRAVDKFMANARGFGMTLVRAASVEAAVSGADIVTVCTAVKGRVAVIDAAMLSPGTHINAIGGDCPGKTELAADILSVGKYFTEFTPQTRVEGEIQQAPADYPVAELWEVLAGVKDGRTSGADITVFDSVGFAVEDFSALRLVHDLTAERRHLMDLIPELADPKNLYGELVGTVAARKVQEPA
ncbi:MAG: ornithine cyclodeaminase [Alphaproteobacteria bacterium]|nr:ornithine cyclodeaminase [Alphaproteobacteria bacterium]MBU1560886.1 ornithine cyclodeaminase [Alphaproteobacteria bacterium]MBU2304860.1 ornithine cyclodeaminase [Alphaproteobacteria bacterium]MBU2367984.1 ornithine cyclodeaminase [Alphaproteobacteria bacterium]